MRSFPPAMAWRRWVCRECTGRRPRPFQLRRCKRRGIPRVLFWQFAANASKGANSIPAEIFAEPKRANRQSAPGRRWQPCSGDEENLIRVRTLNLRAGRKSTHIDIAGVGCMRARDESGLPGNRGAVGDIACGSGCGGLWSRSRRGVLRCRFWRGLGTGFRRGCRIGKLCLCGLGSLIAEAILARGLGRRAHLAPALAGCKHDQECGGGDDPERRFHNYDAATNARLEANLQCKSCRFPVSFTAPRRSA